MIFTVLRKTVVLLLLKSKTTRSHPPTSLRSPKRALRVHGLRLNYFLKSLTKLSLKSFISDRTTHSLADFLVGSSNIELLHRILFSSVFATARRCYVQVSRMVSFFTRGAPCRYLENATGEHFFSQSSPVQHKLCYEVADETRSILAVYIILSNCMVETVGIRWH